MWLIISDIYFNYSSLYKLKGLQLTADNENPGLEVMPLPEEGHDNGNVAFDGERDGGVDRPRKCHLRDGHQIRGQMYVNVICMLK